MVLARLGATAAEAIAERLAVAEARVFFFFLGGGVGGGGGGGSGFRRHGFRVFYFFGGVVVGAWCSMRNVVFSGGIGE